MNIHKKLQVTFKYRKRKVKERRWHVSDIENILKDHQDLYGANQRELSSLQLEIIYNKIRQCYLITLFLRVMSFIQEPKGMNLNDGHNFAI